MARMRTSTATSDRPRHESPEVTARPFNVRRIVALTLRDAAMALREPSTLACYLLGTVGIAFFGSIATVENNAELARLSSAWIVFLAIAIVVTSTVATHLANTIIRENGHGDYLTLVRCGVCPSEIVAAKLIAALGVNAIASMLALLAIDTLCPVAASHTVRTPECLAALLVAGCVGGAPLIVGSIGPSLRSRDFARDGWWVVIPTTLAIVPVVAMISPELAAPLALLPMGPAGELIFSACTGRAPTLPPAALAAVFAFWCIVSSGLLVRAARRFSRSIVHEAATTH